MGVSLIVATLRRSDELRRLLRSVVEQTRREFEVIIVDQNDDDRLAPVIAEFESSGIILRHVRRTEKNLSGARNAGLRLAHMEWVGFPDDDCWYEPDVVAQILACCSDPAVDGVVGRWIERGAPEAQARSLSWQRMSRFREIDTNSIEIFLRRDAVLEIGGFDESLGVARWFGAGEETDLVMRLVRSGKRLLYSPQIRVHHPWAPEVAGSTRERWSRIRGRARGTGALYAKHSLAPSVIARGLVSPIVKCMLPPYRPYHIVSQLATLQGRWEGFIRWRSQHRGGSAGQGT